MLPNLSTGRGLNRRLSDRLFNGLIISRSQRLFRLLFPPSGKNMHKAGAKVLLFYVTAKFLGN